MALATLQSLGGVALAQIAVGGQLLTNRKVMTCEAGLYRETLNTWRICRHVCMAASRDAFNDTIVPLLLGDRTVSFRYGISASDTYTWQPWETHIVTGIETDISSTDGAGYGYRFVLTTADLLVTASFISSVTAFSGTADAILGNQALLPDGLTLLAEPASPTLSLIQRGEPNFDFMVGRLLPLAVDVAGAADYSLYAQANQLHFHTRGWAQGCTAHQVFFNVSGGPGQVSIHYRDALVEAARVGLFGSSTVAYDPLAGASTVVLTTPGAVKILAAGAPDLSAYGPSFVGRHTGQNLLVAETGRSQARYEQARALGFTVTFKFSNYPLLRLGDIIQVVTPDSGDPLGGAYHICSVQTELRGGLASVTAVGRRGEAVTGASQQNPTDPTQVTYAGAASVGGMAAPGVLINPTSLPPPAASGAPAPVDIQDAG